MRIEAYIKTFEFLGGWEGVRHMIRKSTLLGIVAALALGQSSQAEESANGAASPSKPVLTSTISCNGYLNVPMTVDQEQALPMQIMATLECGQQVTVLSDMDAYTVNVLTQDGKNGYVARMYLTYPTRKRIDSAPLPSENAAVSNGIARWQSGGKGSVQFRSGSELVESLTANGVTVQVSLQDTGWKMRANVAVVNSSKQAIYVLPKLVSLDELAPLIKPLRYQDPSQVAKAATHQLLWTSANAAPSLSAQSQRPSSGSELAAVSFKLPATDPSPNYLAQHQVLEETAARSQSPLVDLTREINALALHECTLKPGEKAAGAAWFDRDAKSWQLLLRVPVDGLIFEFPLSFNHEK
jgi:hypothetical protein